MSSVESVVVGVDGSAPSRAAVRWGLGYAHECSIAVRLVHVVDEGWGALGSRLDDELQQGARRLIDEAIAWGRGSYPAAMVEWEIRSGSPMRELSSLSSSDTLIVVGTHKTGFHYGNAFGCRSLQLASTADGPVAVIPESALLQHRGVVVGGDDGPTGWAALQTAAAEADRLAVELTIIRAVSDQGPPLHDEDDLRDWMRSRDASANRLLAEAVARVHEQHPELVTRSRIIRRSAGSALTAVARAAQLLVIGSSRPNELGSTSYDVLQNLTCPTMVVPAAANGTAPFVRNH